MPSPCTQSTTRPSPCTQSTKRPSSCTQSTTKPSPCPQSTTSPLPFIQSTTTPPPCPQSATRPSDQADFSFRTLSVPSPPIHHPHSSRRAYLMSENYVRPSVRTLMKPVMKWRPTDMNNVERACHRKDPWDNTLRLGIMGIPFELCDVYM